MILSRAAVNQDDVDSLASARSVALYRLLLLANFALLLFIALYHLKSATIIFENDQGASFAVAERILHGEFPLSGPPVSYGGRHWSGLYYFYEALMLALGGGNVQHAAMISTVLKVLAFFGLIVFLARTVDPRERSGVLLGSLVAFAAGHYWWMLRAPWHPFFIIFPSILLLVVTYAVFSRGLKYLPLFWLALNLLAVPYNGTLPFVAGCGAVVGIFLLLNHRGDLWPILRSWQFMLATIGAVLIWLPILIYEFHFEHNLKSIFIHKNSRLVPSGIFGSLTGVTSALTRFTISEPHSVDSSSPFLDLATPLVLLLLVILLAYRLRNKASRAQKWLISTAVLIILLYVPAMIQVPKPIGMRLVQSFAPLAILLFSFAFASAIELLLGWHRQRILATAVAVPFLILSTLVASGSIAGNFRTIAGESIHPYESMRHAADVAKVIKQDAAGEVCEIRVSGMANQRQSPMYFLLGPAYYPFMPEAKQFLELPSFQKTGQTNCLYHLSCPGRESGSYMLTTKRVLARYTLSRTLDLSSCQSCSSCELERWDLRMPS